MTGVAYGNVRAVHRAVAVALAVAVAPAGRAAAAGIALTQFTTSGLTRPVDIASAGDSRLFVVEKPGRIRVVQSDGTVLGTPFLDITGLVGDGSNEQGLLGLAFDPMYASNGFFFVNYTDNSGDTVVARYTVSGAPDVANPLSAQVVITIPQTDVNHNGGDLNFGPNDGYLYIGMGDGGGGCDPFDDAQDPQELLGKILRIDVHSGSPYAIPPSNPFAGSVTTREEIWATGVRNPWRVSFDRANGNLYIADVGQGALEEINFQPAAGAGGQNYGWDCYEGTAFGPCTTTATCTPSSLFTPPVHEYTHGGSPFRCSVTGGFVYRGAQFPSLDGRYFFADYCSGDFWSLTTPDNGMSWNVDGFGAPISGFNATSFGENSAGELFVADDASGHVYRIEALADPPDCPAIPAPGCTTTAKSILKAKRPGEDAKNKLIWKWLNGPALDQGDFGDPISGGTAYRLCVYNGAGSKVIDVAVPDGSAWETISNAGYKYSNPSTAVDGGAFKVLLKGGSAGKSKLLVKGKKANLDLDALPLNEGTQLLVQLLRNDSSACWEATFPVAAIDVDSATQLKAKVP